MKTGNLFLGVILVIAITLLLRLPYVLFVPILNVDEAVYALRAAMMIESGAILYVDVIADTSPLMNYLYAVVFRLFGVNNILAVQLLGVVWTLLTTAVLYRIARILSSRRAAFLTAVFYAVCSTTFNPPDMIAANAELFMVLPLAVGALFFLRGLRDRSNRDYWIAGFFCGVGFSFKQPGIIYLGAMFLFLVIFALAGKITPKVAIKKASLVLAGFLVTVVVTLAYLFFRGALAEFYFWTLAYRFKYVNVVPLLEGALTALRMLGALTVPNFIFWICVLISILSLKRLRLKSGYAFCWLWSVFSLAGAAAGRRPWHHYYIQVVPPFAVLAGLGAAAAIDWSLLRKKKIWWGVFLKSAIAVSLAAAVFITFPGSLESMYGSQFRRFYRFKRLEHPVQRLADYIQENTSKPDLIYVWIFATPIYVLSNRLSASRFIVADYIVGASPGGKSLILIPGVREAFLKDLELNRPVYFIDVSLSGSNYPIARYPFLWKYLHANYELESVIDQSLVYKRRKQVLAAEKIPFFEDESQRKIADFNRALEIDPNNAEFYFLRGDLYRKKRDLTSASLDWDRAIGIHPAFTDAYFNRANARFLLGDADGALADYRRTIELKPDYALAHYNLGVVLRSRGEIKAALESFKRAIEMDPEIVRQQRGL